MCSPCRTLPRVTKSPSVKRKSPTSAWRRSMCSTRRTRQRLAEAYNWLAAAAVAMAAAMVAEAAEVEGAVAAEAVAVWAVAGAAVALVAAVLPGALAAGARLDRIPIAFTKTRHHGRARQGRPGQLLFWLLRCSHACVSRFAHGGGTGLQPYRGMQTREPKGKTAVAGEYLLHRRSGAMGTMRVLTS